MNNKLFFNSLFLLVLLNTTLVFASIETTLPTKASVTIDADRSSGIIGITSDVEVEDLSDNYFNVALPFGTELSASNIYLEYDLYGVSDWTQTTKSINGSNATGGNVIQTTNEWHKVREPLNPQLLREGKNLIFFNRREDVSYQYQVKNVRISVVPKDHLTSFSKDILVNDYGTQTTLTGFLEDPTIKKIRVYNEVFSIKDGTIDIVLNNSFEDKELHIYWIDANGNETPEILPVLVKENTPTYIFSQNITENTALIALEKDKLSEFEAVSFMDASENIGETTLSVTGLAFKDMHMPDAGTVMVTEGNYEAYRLKQTGNTTSKDNLKVALRYDLDKIPTGYSAKDVRIFSFDKAQKQWKQLRVDSLDIVNQRVFSKFNGDTDYVNGVLKVPEMPETASYIPTTITDMEYANPAAGIVQIPPPSPNNTGALTTSFPIKLPKGRNGMTPNLTVSYNSEGGNGWMGMGWDVQLPALTLDTRWGAPRFDPSIETEMYSLNGQSLVVKVGDEYTSPHRYYNPDDPSDVLLRADVEGFYLRKEGSYVKIERHGDSPGNYSWEITDKFGNKSFYGWKTSYDDNDGNAVVYDALGENITHWALYETHDTYGNFVRYTYDKESTTTNGVATKSFYPSRIEYTLYGADSPSFYQVDLLRNDYSLGGSESITRKDISLNARTGTMMVTTDLLTEVKIRYIDNGQSDLIRGYRFDYNEEQFNKTHLASISEYDSSGDIFYTHVMDYYDEISTNNIIDNTPINWTGGETSFDSKIHDIFPNSSGLPNGSLLHTSSSKGGSGALRLGVGFGADGTNVIGTIGASFNYSQSKEKTQISFIDINGDGLPDKVYNDINGGIKYQPNEGFASGQGSFGLARNITDVTTLDETKTRTFGFGVNAYAYVIGVGGSVSLTRMDTDSYFTDFNGDGLPDVLDGSIIKFNETNSNQFQTIPFGVLASETENPIISGSIDSSIIDDLDLESLDDLRAQYAQFDHVTTWEAQYSGVIKITGTANLLIQNDCNDPMAVNNFKLTIERANADQVSGNTSLVGTGKMLSSQGQSVSFSESNIVVNQGDILFFRSHNLNYGCGGKINWNPLIEYTDLEPNSGSTSLPNFTDEHGKNYRKFNPKDDFILNNGGGWSPSLSTASVLIDPQLNSDDFEVNQFSDTVNYVITKRRRTIDEDGALVPDSTVEEKWNYSYIPETGDINPSPSSFQTDTPLDAGGNLKYYYSFIFSVESNSNVQWDEVIWQPNVTQEADLIYPPVNVKTYDRKLNSRRYWIKANSFPSFSIDPDDPNDATEKVLQLEHDVFNQNYSALLNQMDENDPPIKINWVYKKNINGVPSTVSTKSFYLFKDCSSGNCIAVFRASENPNDPLLQTLSSYNSFFQYNITKEESNNLKTNQATISASLYVDNEEFLNIIPADVIIQAHPDATNVNYTTKSFRHPIYSTSNSLFGTTFRGWSQFLYNGGINYSVVTEEQANNDPNLDFGDIIPDPSTSFDGPIEMDVFAIDTSDAPTQQEIDEYEPGQPTTADIVRYAFYDQQPLEGVYTNPNIFNIDSEQITYGNDTNGELITATGRFGNYNIFDLHISEEELLGNGSVFVALKQRAKSTGFGISGEVSSPFGGVSGSYSESRSKTLNQYVDLNGDRYPDLITKKRIQYTKMTGGLSNNSNDIKNNNFTSGSDQSGTTNGVNIAGMFPNSTENTNNNNTNTNINSGLNSSEGIVDNMRQWLDINGDGLTDKVKVEENRIVVQLNLGYTFTGDIIWGDGFSDLVISRREGNSIGTGGGISGINLNSDDVTASFTFGLGAGNSIATGNIAFVDINADGLPDLLQRNQTNGHIFYYLNNGDRFEANSSNNLFTADGNNVLSDNIGLDYSLSANAFASATVGFSIPLYNIKITISGTAGISAAFNEKQVSIQDINGDGYPDILTQGADNGQLIAYLNNLGKTHKLRTVKSALGSNWTADYTRLGNTFDMPQSQYVFTRLETNDGFNGDSEIDVDVDNAITTINYAGPKQNRREREFMGFAGVTINQLDPSNESLFRRQYQNYHTDNIYLKGALRLQNSRDAGGNLLSQSEHLYNLMDPENPQTNLNLTDQDNFLQSSLDDEYLDFSRLFVTNVKKVNKEFENGAFLDTEEQFTTFDNSGNLKYYVHLGDTHTAIAGQDGIATELTYFDNIPGVDNGRGFVKQMKVKGLGDGNIYRIREATYNNNGSMNSMKTRLNNTEESTVALIYDDYGNVTKSTLEDDFFTEITYDDNVHTFPTEVTNSWEGIARAIYDYRFGVPVVTLDINGQRMRTRIDDRGRMVEVTAPKEIGLTDENTRWTIRMNYEGDMNDPEPFNGTNYVVNASGSFIASNPEIVETDAKHHAVTSHNVALIQQRQLQTISIIDGTGSAIQSKKTLFHHSNGEGQRDWLVSGKARQDAFGRIYEQYLPTLEGSYPASGIATSEAFNYNGAINSIAPVQMTYDTKDRALTVKQPDESQNTTTEFSINDGYFITKATNELGQTMEIKTDVKGRKRQTIQNDELTTTCHYNAIGEKIRVRNHQGYDALYAYDMAGRRTEEKHPDRGVIQFTYDTSNNLIEKKTSNLLANGQGAIQYDYDHNRLIGINYPMNPTNNVSLTYGTPSTAGAQEANAIGRLFMQEDASGVQGFSYDEMGNMSEHLRGVTVPGKHTFWYLTSYKYDSFNRVHTIVYPDQEKVGYHYNLGGTLMRIAPGFGDNNIIDEIRYTQYGEQSNVLYGNGTEITYDYDSRRRMSSLQNVFSDYDITKLYEYDGLSNITSISTQTPTQALPGLHKLGGPVSHEYTYDNYNRLVGASGRYVGPNDFTTPYLAQEYTLDMQYDLAHNIIKKTQTHYQGEVNGATAPITNPSLRPETHYQLDYSGYASGENFVSTTNGSYGYVQPHAPREILERPDGSIGDETNPKYKRKLIDYDANGNMLSIKQVISPDGNVSPTGGMIDPTEITLQEYIWDEENRLRAVNLNPEETTPHPLAVYTYDSGGQRIIRHIPGRIDVNSNADAVSNNEREEIVLYPSSMITSKAIGEKPGAGRRYKISTYTKHYYSGSQRVYSALGTATNLGLFPSLAANHYPQIRDIANDKLSPAATALLQTYQQMEQSIALPAATVEGSTPRFTHIHREYDAYWYHADQLGSSSYISDRNGNVTQHMEYLPFGELLVDEHKNSYNTPYKFNGKELDEETGNYYYGARYYNPKWSIWLGVDPLAEQMPSWSPYNYTFNNPIRFTDPDGRAPEDVIILIGGAYKGHPYGHVAIGIINNDTGETVIYDFGRYGAVSGTFSESGEGILRVHSSLESYIEGENATGRTTSGYRFKSTPEEDAKVVEYFNGLIDGSTKAKTEVKDKRWSFKLEDDYHATGNNCTTLSLCGLEEAIPGVAKELKDPKESKGRGLGWKEKLADKTIGNNSIGNKIFMPADLKKNIDTKKKHIDSKQYSNKIKE